MIIKNGDVRNIALVTGNPGTGKSTLLVNDITDVAENTNDAIIIDNIEDTIETLEDAIITAITQTSKKASDEMESKIKSVTGGISIPGLC